MEILKKLLIKLSSRKFMVAIGCISSGLVSILNGSTQEGLIAICTAVVAYLAVEGYIDSKALKNNLEEKTNECEREEDIVG